MSTIVSTERTCPLLLTCRPFVYQNLKTLPVEIVVELLEEEAGNTDAEWLLWMGVRGMIANPAFAFPLIKVPIICLHRARVFQQQVHPKCVETSTIPLDFVHVCMR
jgi:hypothetical protein